jgi:lipopolysaccharide transport system permease protein
VQTPFYSIFATKIVVSAPKRHIIIEPGRLEKNYWTDVWEQRELVFILSWRDISVKYKQSVVGYGWSIFRPLTTLLIFVLLFQNVLNTPIANVPYSIVVLCGIIPWSFFSNALSSSSEILIVNSSMISKVYFPRIYLPLSAIFISFPDFLISLVLLMGLMLYYSILPTFHLLLLPITFFFLVLLTSGVAFLLSALNVKFRDFRHLTTFLLQIGMYASPVAYTLDIVPEKWKWLYSLNPLVGYFEAIRWSVIPNYNPLDIKGYSYSILATFALLYLGVRYYRRTERGFADSV